MQACEDLLKLTHICTVHIVQLQTHFLIALFVNMYSAGDLLPPLTLNGKVYSLNPSYSFGRLKFIFSTNCTHLLLLHVMLLLLYCVVLCCVVLCCVVLCCVVLCCVVLCCMLCWYCCVHCVRFYTFGFYTVYSPLVMS